MNSGFILIDKPAGITSHDVVATLRRITGVQRIGHGGTLDPFATGLLIVGIGREATKHLSTFLSSSKEYTATLHLGAISDTYDRDGVITPQTTTTVPSRTMIEDTLKTCIGKMQQIPPLYSAKKVHGKKLYELARAGIAYTPQPSTIEIFTLELIDYMWPTAVISVSCSAGTYIRSLAHDIGQTLACGAYLTELRRTKSGTYSVENAIQLAAITPENWSSLLFLR